MTERLSLVVVDDHPMLRRGVVDTLEEHDGVEVVGEGENTADAVRLARDLLPDIILLDVEMPGGGGISAISDIVRECPVVKIVMLTVSEDEEIVSDAFAEGASGYILKGVSGPEFVGALRAIQSGAGYVPPHLAAKLLAEARQVQSDSVEKELLDRLTRREEEILQLVSDGLSNREIGDRLNLREKSVKTYMTNILQKLKVRNRVKAALMAQRQKMLHKPE